MVDISSYLGKQIVTHAEFANSETSFQDLSNTYDLSVAYNRDDHQEIIRDFFTKNDINVNDEQFNYVLDAIDEELTNIPNTSIEDILHLLTQLHGEEINTTIIIHDQDYDSIYTELDSDKDGHLELNTFVDAIESLLGATLDDDLADYINEYYFTVVATNGLFTKSDMSEFLEMIDDEEGSKEQFDSDKLHTDNLETSPKSQGLFSDVTALFQEFETPSGADSFKNNYSKNLDDISRSFDSEISYETPEAKLKKVENFIIDINSYFEAQPNISDIHINFASDLIKHMLNSTNIPPTEKKKLTNFVTNPELKIRVQS